MDEIYISKFKSIEKFVLSDDPITIQLQIRRFAAGGKFPEGKH